MNENISAPYPKPPAEAGSVSRMGSARDVLTAAETLINNNTEGERGRKWSQQLGMVQGNPPYSTSEHRANASRWMSNFNPMTGKAMLQSACIPFYNLFETGPVQAVIRLNNKNKEVARRKSRIVTTHFQWLLEEADISDAFYRVAHSFVGFGRGFWYWIEPYQWVPDVRAFYEVLFPEQCSTNHRRWEWVCIRDSYEPCYLWGMKGREGWNDAAIQDACRATLPRKSSTDDWIEYQHALQEHSLSTTATAGSVDCVVCLVKEANGMWSYGIVAREAGVNYHEGRTTPEFLYLKRDAFDCITDVLCPFIYDTASGRINGCDGLCSSIFATVRVKDRLKNKIVDGGQLRTLTVLSARSANAQVKSGLTVVGGVATLPPGFDAQPGTILTDISGPIMVDRVLTEDLSRNSGVYMPTSERPVGNPKSATQAQLDFQQQTVISSSGVARFYRRLDTAWDTLYKRVLKAAKDPAEGEDSEMAKEFIQRCKDDDVTLEELKDVDSVKAYRVGGGGSEFQRQLNLEGMVPLAGAMPARGRQNFFEDYTASKAGPDKVDAYFPVDVDEPGEAEWEASVENVQASAGAAPLFTPNQQHEGHVKVHMQVLVSGLQSLQQGADPSTVYAFGQVMIPHVSQHLQAWALDPTAKDKVKAATKQLAVLKQEYDGLLQAVQQQQADAQTAAQAQAVQQGQDPDTQLKAAKAQAQLQLKGQKQQAEMTMSAAEHLQQMRQLEEKHRLDLAVTASEAEAKAAQPKKTA